MWRSSVEENEHYKTTDPEEYIEDFWLTDAIVKETQKLVETYIQKLEDACAEQKTHEVLSSVQWFMEALNSPNETHDDFIETIERDQLGEFADKAIELTGLKVPQGLDITLQWREW